MIKKILYDLLGPKLQADLDRFRYYFKILPRVNPTHTSQDWLPKPYRAALVISADLELGWAWRYARSTADPMALSRQAARQTRANFPALLELFDRYEVPVTWAVVGHLFLDHCERSGGKAHPNLPRPAYFENEYWRYNTGDWYDCDPCSSLSESPEWYAPDLIHEILSAKVSHEIACHTFSHIDCSKEFCPINLLESELKECCLIAQKWGISFKSLVFPGFLTGNFRTVQKMGFKAYRWHGRYEIDYPQLDQWGLWRIPGGVFWEKPDGWSPTVWAAATCRCIDCAIQTRSLIHFWFHPSCADINVRQTFPALLEYIQSKRNELWVVTMREMAEFLSPNTNKPLPG